MIYIKILRFSGQLCIQFIIKWWVVKGGGRTGFRITSVYLAAESRYYKLHFEHNNLVDYQCH